MSDKPNIVFILIDNVGWGDFSVYGGTTATPRIDKMASEGIRFNSYNVEAQCTPTRSVDDHGLGVRADDLRRRRVRKERARVPEHEAWRRIQGLPEESERP